MGRIVGDNRDQAMLFPMRLDELVETDHLVRVIDVWASQLDMNQLGFAKAQAAHTGRPSYDPADLLKLYLYGYLSQVRSSRRLERECKRNIEVMWLLKRLAPDFKTIAEFRRINTAGLIAVCAGFVQFARAQRLIAGEIVAIDGTKIRAVASNRAVLRPAQLKEEETQLAQSIAQYMQRMDDADQSEVSDEPKRQAVRQTLSALREQHGRLQQQARQLQESGKTHLVSTEPEARLLKSGQGNVVGYNLQTAVDAAHGLIVHHTVCQDANDNRQLLPMAVQTKEILEQDHLTVVADAGYSNGSQLADCEKHGITPYVPVQRAINNQGDGNLYSKGDFSFNEAQDCYVCPAGEVLQRKQIHNKDRLVIYATKEAVTCAQCAQKPRCAAGSRRFISRHIEEAVLERIQRRTADRPDMMRLRRATVEHPFGTLKERILGNGRLLMRGISGARSELSLAALAYNFKRVGNILGTTRMLQAVRG